MFYDNFVKACNLHNKAPSAVAIDIGISKATVTGWKNGSTPSDATLRKIADYFGVSPEELTGSNEPAQRITTDGLSAEALDVAQAYDRADKRAKDMVKLALEPFGLSGAEEAAM